MDPDGRETEHAAEARLERREKAARCEESKNCEYKDAKVARPGGKTYTEKDVEQLEAELDFDQVGPGEYGMALGIGGHPLVVKEIESEAYDAAAQNYPKREGHDDERDAFRHAYFSYRLSEEVGPRLAKAWTDAHERSNPNPAGERLMDLYNNNVGRRLQAEHGGTNFAQLGKPYAVKVIRDALRSNALMRRPLPVENNKPDGSKYYKD